MQACRKSKEETKRVAVAAMAAAACGRERRVSFCGDDGASDGVSEGDDKVVVGRFGDERLR